MTGPVRSTVLAAAHIVNSSQNTLVTCPPGVTYIIKDVHIFIAGSAASVVVLYVQRTADLWINLVQESMQAGQVLSRQPYVVMAAGDFLGISSSVPDCRIWVSGTRLTGVAVVP